MMAKTSSQPLCRKKPAANMFQVTMNKFLNRKKSPEALTANDEALHALSAPPPAPQISPGLKKSGTSRWKRAKKPIEVKPELNIAAALPATDDFRTSLLMPNLSARFSMLREQDDPRSMLGKASDDSVLQPRRRSRMDFNGLGDIAEVSSISSQPRPPFAAFGRQDSFASEDGYASDNGSVISRARPGEGNTMFGGRQKVYMIPKTGGSSSRGGGRAVYEDDIGKSAFQKYRQERELEGRVSDESQGFDFGLDQSANGDLDAAHEPTPNDSAKDLSHSPSLSSYEKKRSTNSTLHSDARSSTAATSVASQPVTNASSPAVVPTQTSTPPPAIPSSLKRSDTKTRRLYEQGLDQHMYEQQTSALSRLNSIQRQRTLNSNKQPPYLHSTKSASNLQETARQPVYAIRPQSPEVASPPLLNTSNLISQPRSNGPSPVPSLPHSPTMPNMDTDGGNALSLMLDPSDRGKATAMGAFSKPKQSFDEDQYLERQRQLQRSTSSAANKKEPSAIPALPQRLGRFEQDRERSDSDASARSRSRSASKPTDAPSAYNVFQRAAQMNTQPGAHQQFDKSSLPDTHRTFFGNISASDSEEEEEEPPRSRQQSVSRQAHPQPSSQQSFSPPDYGYGTHHGRWQPSVLPSVREHPAFRQHKAKPSLAEEDEDMEPKPLRPAQSSKSLRQDASEEETKSGVQLDAPNVGGAGPVTTPLAGLMQHLRQRSNVSSIFPNEEPAASDAPEMPEWNPTNLDLVNRPIQSTIDSDSRAGSGYTSSNPFDLDEIDNTSRGDDTVRRGSVSPIDSVRSPTFGAAAPSRSTLLNRQSAVSDLEPEAGLTQDPEQESETSWQEELQKQHTRNTSTATQRERDAFANELAARRNAIQENMKSMVERETQSRGASPAPSSAGAFKAFGMLRSKPSRESVVDNGRPMQAPPKAMKMLGMGGSGANSSSNTLNSQYERGGYSLDISRQRDDSFSRPSNFGRPRDDSASRSPNLGRSRNDSGSVPPMPNNQARMRQPSEQDSKREWDPQTRSRENSEANRPDRQPQTGRSPASSGGARSRANSEAGGARSRSRTGRYRDDLEKAMIEGTGSSAAGVPELSPMIPHELTPRPSPDIVQGAFDPPRARASSRADSRAGMTDYFGSKNLQPIQTGRERLSPGGVSPVTLSPNVYTPSGSSARPSPTVAAAPYAHNMTPPLSGASTPVGSAFSPPPQASAQPVGRQPLRKKTISKGDISEPTLISSTSNIDTVNLPEGASLKNGMDEQPPPVPPINPRRRATKAIFGLTSRLHSDDSIPTTGTRSKTPDPWVSRGPTEPDFTMEVARANRGAASNARSPPARMPKQSLDQMRPYGFSPSNGSPERVERTTPPRRPMANGMDGGMF